MITFFRRFLLVLAHCGLAAALGQSTPSSSAQGAPQSSAAAPTSVAPTATAVSLATDPSYRLSVGDQIAVTIYDEPELASNELIDNAGVAKLALIKDTKLAGLTVRDAEKAIAALYMERQILKKPDVKLVVVSFAPREVILFGEVRNPGGLAFPRDLTSMDIVEVITRAGGFTVRAKGNAVTVMRKSADGSKETSTVVNVEAMMGVRSGSEQRRLEFPIYPGDRLIVGERYF